MNYLFSQILEVVHENSMDNLKFLFLSFDATSSISIALNILYSREFYYIQSPQSPMVEVAPRIFLWLRAFVIVKESKQKLTMVVDLTISRRLLVPILSIKMQFYDKAGKLRHSTFTNENR